MGRCMNQMSWQHLTYAYNEYLKSKALALKWCTKSISSFFWWWECPLKRKILKHCAFWIGREYEDVVVWRQQSCLPLTVLHTPFSCCFLAHFSIISSLSSWLYHFGFPSIFSEFAHMHIIFYIFWMVNFWQSFGAHRLMA